MMKISIPYRHGRHGEVRQSDGKIFWGYIKRRKKDGTEYLYEDWRSPESFKLSKEKKKKYYKNPNSKNHYKKYREQNLEKIKERVKRHYLNNKEYFKEKNKKWYQKNKEKILLKYKTAEWKQKINLRNRTRRKNDPIFTLIGRMRTRINASLKQQGSKKLQKTIKYIGCSCEFLKKHIESQFKEGMSWEDRSSFHIDHIRPLASFDLTNPKEAEKAFHWSNLQPLYPEENLKKGKKLNIATSDMSYN